MKNLALISLIVSTSFPIAITVGETNGNFKRIKNNYFKY